MVGLLAESGGKRRERTRQALRLPTPTPWRQGVIRDHQAKPSPAQEKDGGPRPTAAGHVRTALGFTSRGAVVKRAWLSCTRFRRHQVRCFMEQEVGHGATEVHARVQA